MWTCCCASGRACGTPLLFFRPECEEGLPKAAGRGGAPWACVLLSYTTGQRWEAVFRHERKPVSFDRPDPVVCPGGGSAAPGDRRGGGLSMWDPTPFPRKLLGKECFDKTPTPLFCAWWCWPCWWPWAWSSRPSSVWRACAPPPTLSTSCARCCWARCTPSCAPAPSASSA